MPKRKKKMGCNPNYTTTNQFQREKKMGCNPNYTTTNQFQREKDGLLSKLHDHEPIPCQREKRWAAIQITRPRTNSKEKKMGCYPNYTTTNQFQREKDGLLSKLHDHEPIPIWKKQRTFLIHEMM